MHPSCALKNFNGELLSIVGEKHRQPGVHAQSTSTDTESEAKDHDVVRPKTT